MIEPRDTMECPRCGKKGLVRRSHNLYQCLACNFRRDFSQVFFGEEALLAIAVLIVLLLVFLFSTQTQTTQDSSEIFNPVLNKDASLN